MSKFTNPLIATALAIAVTGTAVAEFAEGLQWSGSQLKVQIKPNSCKNFNSGNKEGTIRTWLFPRTLNQGRWSLQGYSFDDFAMIEGDYIERKVGKDLTASLFSKHLGGCDHQFCVGIVGVIQDYLSDESCGAMTDAQANDFSLTKGQIKLSKSGERLKVTFKVEGEYTDDKGNVKKVKATIKSPNMDSEPFTQPPLY